MNKIPTSNYKIRFHDCDMFGHLNNARYLDYMISARQDHLKEAYDFDYNGYYKNNLGWVINYQEIQYLKPAVFDETVCIRSSFLNADHESLHVEICMLNESRSHLKAILRTKLKFISLKTGQKERHTEEFVHWAKSLIPDTALAEIPIQERITQLIQALKQKDHTI